MTKTSQTTLPAATFDSILEDRKEHGARDERARRVPAVPGLPRRRGVDPPPGEEGDQDQARDRGDQGRVGPRQARGPRHGRRSRGGRRELLVTLERDPHDLLPRNFDMVSGLPLEEPKPAAPAQEGSAP